MGPASKRAEHVSGMRLKIKEEAICCLAIIVTVYLCQNSSGELSQIHFSLFNKISL